jgi:hypothetical protein
MQRVYSPATICHCSDRASGPQMTRPTTPLLSDASSRETHDSCFKRTTGRLMPSCSPEDSRHSDADRSTSDSSCDEQQTGLCAPVSAASCTFSDAESLNAVSTYGSKAAPTSLGGESSEPRTSADFDLSKCGDLPEHIPLVAGGDVPSTPAGRCPFMHGAHGASPLARLVS